MDFEEGLRWELRSLEGLANKVFAIAASKGIKAPYLVYTLGGNERTKTLSGFDGLVQPQYQLEFYHSTQKGLKELKKLLITNVKSYELKNIGGLGPFVQQVDILTEFEDYDTGAGLYKGIIEFDAHYTE